MKLSRFLFFKRQRGAWAIFIMALLALVLTMWCLANLLLLSAVASQPAQEVSQSRIWTVFLLNTLFSLAFAASAYGLWTRRNWGRLLFMGSITIWVSFYIISLFITAGGDYSVSALAVNIIVYVTGAGGVIWYLNMSHIKALFDTSTQEDNEQI